MKKRILTGVIISMVVLSLGVYVVFFSGIMESALHNSGNYEGVMTILKVKYTFVKSDKTLDSLCSYSYLVSQNNGWDEKSLEEANRYYKHAYSNAHFVRDNMFYSEYLKILSELSNFVEYREVCISLFKNTDGSTILIADSLETVYKNGTQNDKEWVKDAVNTILTDDNLILTSTKEEREQIEDYYKAIFEAQK